MEGVPGLLRHIINVDGEHELLTRLPRMQKATDSKGVFRVLIGVANPFLPLPNLLRLQ